MGRVMLTRRTLTVWAVLLVLSIGAAAYAGFRLPNLWIATIYSVPPDAGFIRRGAIGFLVSPLAAISGSHYFAVSLIALLILGLVLGVIAYNFLRAPWNSQRILILIFLLAPTGGFLFHEVGYLEQALFLAFALSFFLWSRTNPLLAIAPLVVGAWFHEMVLVTMWPILLWVGIIQGLTRLRALALGLPALAALALALLPRPSASEVNFLESRMSTTLDFSPRSDALQLFARPLSELWSEYSVVNGLLELLPMALVLSIIWVGIIIFRPTGFARQTNVLVGAWLVTLAPLLLVFAGWDFSRWLFLAFVNFAIVVFILLGQSREDCTKETLAWLLLPFIVLFAVGLQYFDGFSPRSSTTYEISQNLRSSDFLDLPTK